MAETIAILGHVVKNTMVKQDKKLKFLTWNNYLPAT